MGRKCSNFLKSQILISFPGSYSLYSTKLLKLRWLGLIKEAWACSLSFQTEAGGSHHSSSWRQSALYHLPLQRPCKEPAFTFLHYTASSYQSAISGQRKSHTFINIINQLRVTHIPEVSKNENRP